MIRVGSTTLVLLALSAWAGAQGPSRPSLSAAEQLRLHRANKNLLADLVNNGIQLGAAQGPLNRVEACQATARSLGVAIQRAAEIADSDRVVEIAGHLELVVRDGLVPLVDEAKIHISKESPEYARLKEAQKIAASNLDEAREAMGRMGDAERNREISTRLHQLKNQLKK